MSVMEKFAAFVGSLSPEETGAGDAADDQFHAGQSRCRHDRLE